MNLRLPVTQDEITSRYRKLAFQWHPDYAGNTPANNKKMQKLNKTFSILTGMDPRALDIEDSEVVSFKRTKADISIDSGLGFSIEISSGSPGLGWIYAADFCSSSNEVFVSRDAKFSKFIYEILGGAGVIVS